MSRQGLNIFSLCNSFSDNIPKYILVSDPWFLLSKLAPINHNTLQIYAQRKWPNLNNLSRALQISKWQLEYTYRKWPHFMFVQISKQTLMYTYDVIPSIVHWKVASFAATNQHSLKSCYLETVLFSACSFWKKTKQLHSSAHCFFQCALECNWYALFLAVQKTVHIKCALECSWKRSYFSVRAPTALIFALQKTVHI